MRELEDVREEVEDLMEHIEDRANSNNGEGKKEKFHLSNSDYHFSEELYFHQNLNFKDIRNAVDTGQLDLNPNNSCWVKLELYVLIVKKIC